MLWLIYFKFLNITYLYEKTIEIISIHSTIIVTVTWKATFDKSIALIGFKLPIQYQYFLH